jgi:signal transduction histidine kinase
MMKSQAERRNIFLEASVPLQPVMINADIQQIERILLNLLSNALKYTREKGQASIKVYPDEDSAIIEVKDNGYGIPIGEIDTIFNRFSRLSEHRDKAPGTGLGLAITQAIIKAHNGEITVTSEENVGSTFKVNLPLNLQKA